MDSGDSVEHEVVALLVAAAAAVVFVMGEACEEGRRRALLEDYLFLEMMEPL